MKFAVFLFGFLSLLSCSKNKTPPEALISSDTTSRSIQDADTTSQTIENDCLFNNNYEALTLEWLSEVGIANGYTWNDSSKYALLPIGSDTIFVTKGGCVHFGMTVTWRLYNDKASLGNRELWLARALDLSKKFKLDYYESVIEDGLAKAIPTESENALWFEIPDDDENDNLYYEGIEVIINSKYHEITLSQYFD